VIEDVMITIPSTPQSRPLPSLRGYARVAATMAFLMLATGAVAQERFSTADDAVAALIAAAKVADPTGLTRVLGPGSREIVSSGDPVADATARKRVIEAYDAKHQVVMEGADKAVLVIGDEDWPFPIPLVRANGQWRFDTAAGRDEILFRRIGRNELAAIQTCLAYVDAQQEYSEKGVSGGGVYAQRIVSTAGKKDGLYWPVQSGEEGSPLGELAAAAASEGYRPGQQRIPYHGYYYKVLTRQGPNAPGGALDYVVRGKMIGGFALVAYPAEYKSSGVMTFLVSHQGKVYEKDLGPGTRAVAESMTAFNPDSTWQQVADPEQSSTR
jgi:DUF2950 family protein